MPTVYAHTSKRPMTGEEFRHIRTARLKASGEVGLTQEQLRSVVYRGIDRISSWENNRAEIPKIVAAHMRLLAK